MFYKTTNRDGKDFWTGTVDYARGLKTGEVIRHPSSRAVDPNNDATYLSISSTLGDSLGSGGIYPRLFCVEPVGTIVPVAGSRAWGNAEIGLLPSDGNWYGVLALRVLEELPILEAYGPNAQAFQDFFDLIKQLPPAVLWEMGRRYSHPVEGFMAQVERVTKGTGVRAGVVQARYLTMFAAAGTLAQEQTERELQSDAVMACVEVAMGVLTRGLIPAGHTAKLMRTWREVFGADYA